MASPTGILEVFDVSTLPSQHPGVKIERGGKAIVATATKGFLSYGPYRKGYPAIPLEAVFSILIDNNTAQDGTVLSLDVHDQANNQVLATQEVRRRQFSKANDFVVFKLRFTPRADANLEFRIYYQGGAYILANKIAVVDPSQIDIKEASDIQPGTTPVPPQPQPSSHADQPHSPTQTTGPKKIEGTPVIDDPLTTGVSVGLAKGGAFTSDGYKITAAQRSCLVYDTSVKKNIGIEFDAQGYLPGSAGENMVGVDDKYNIIILHDAPDPCANWDQASVQQSPNFLFQLRKIANVPGEFAYTTDCVKLKTGSSQIPGYEKWYGRPRMTPLEWNPAQRYHWVFKIVNGVTEIWRDDLKLYNDNTGSNFAPANRIVVWIGGTPYGRLGPRNVTYSNVRIYQL